MRGWKLPGESAADAAKRLQPAAWKWNAICVLAWRALRKVPQSKYGITVAHVGVNDSDELKQLHTALQSDDDMRHYYAGRVDSYHRGIVSKIFKPFDLSGELHDYRGSV